MLLLNIILSFELYIFMICQLYYIIQIDLDSYYYNKMVFNQAKKYNIFAIHLIFILYSYCISYFNILNLKLLDLINYQFF